MQEGSFLAVADNEGDLELWDVPQKKVLRRMTGHSGRVATMDWNQHILASGDRSGRVHLHDVRVPDHHVFTLNHHVQVNRITQRDVYVHVHVLVISVISGSLRYGVVFRRQFLGHRIQR